jgi:hypothetical protein
VNSERVALGATIGMLTAGWRDLDRLLSHVSDAMAVVQPGPGRASVAWTVGHLANQADGWINVRFAAREPHPLLSANRWRMGSDGTADDWAGIQLAVSEVRAASMAFLADVTASQLDAPKPYYGSIPDLKERTISLRYSIIRVTVHTYYHVGAMASDLVAVGLSVGDYPGSLIEVLSD